MRSLYSVVVVDDVADLCDTADPMNGVTLATEPAVVSECRVTRLSEARLDEGAPAVLFVARDPSLASAFYSGASAATAIAKGHYISIAGNTLARCVLCLLLTLLQRGNAGFRFSFLGFL